LNPAEHGDRTSLTPRERRFWPADWSYLRQPMAVEAKAFEWLKAMDLSATVRVAKQMQE
jgi:hypothetical protein